MSGLTMAGVDANGKFAVPGPVTAENAITATRTPAVPGIRQFTRARSLRMYTVYNPRTDPATGKPNLSVQVNLFHNGTKILEGKPQVSALESQSDRSRINDYAYMRLNIRIQNRAITPCR